MFAEKAYKSIQQVINQVEKYFSIIYLFFIVFVLLYSELLFGLLFPAYLPAVKYLKLLIPIPYLDSILHPYLGNLVEAKKQSIFAQISIINSAISILLQIILVPSIFFNQPMAGLGIWGIVIIQWISAIGNNIIFRYCSKKFFDIASTVKYWKHLLNFGFTFTLIFGLNQILSTFILNPLILFTVSFSILLTTYFTFFYVSHEISVQDLRFFLSLMKPSSYLKTLKDELKRTNEGDLD